MKISRVTNELAEKFLEQTFSSPTHWPDWNMLIEKYYNTSFFYLGAYENNVLIGICPFHELKHKKILRTRSSGQFKLIPYGGWIFSTKKELKKKFFQTSWRNTMELYSLPNIEEFSASYSQVYTLQKQTLIIDLSKNLDEIWSNCINSKRRNMIRKAEKEDITISSCASETNLKEFYQLYLNSVKEYSNFSLPYEFFYELKYRTNNIKFTILTAWHNETQISNVGVISDKNYSIYWLGNNEKKHPNLGQSELLQWEAIKLMKENGCKYYDLCYIEPTLLPNIYSFKKGFSKQIFNISYLKTRSFSFRAINKILG
jgi:hypothetical protein